MNGIEMDVSVAVDILDAFRDIARKVPGKTRTAYRRNVGRLRSRLLARVKVEPGKPHYPLRWKSDRQRRYVMAKLREENNLPYQRTGKLLNSYELELVEEPTSAILRLVNNDPKARFVVGDDAQPFHLDTGWVQMSPVIAEGRNEAEDLLIETYFTVADEFAGVPR